MNMNIKQEADAIVAAMQRGEIGADTANAKLDELQGKADALAKAKLYRGGMAQDLNVKRDDHGVIVGGYNATPAMHPAMTGHRGIASVKSAIPTPAALTTDELQELAGAQERRLPSYSLTCKATQDDIVTKAAPSPLLSESGSTGASAAWPIVPPALLPGIVPLFFEPTRISHFLPVIGGQAGPSVQWVRHTSNAGSDPAVTAEGTAKPEAAPNLKPIVTDFAVIAGIYNTTRQLFSDFADVQSYLPMNLATSLYNAENDAFLNGTTAFDGLLNTTGTLSRTQSGSDTAIDVLAKAYNDIRVESGVFGNADLVILHPSDLLTLRLLKATDGRYIIDPYSPLAGLAGVDNILGVRAVATTQIAQGKAVVLDTSKAARIYVREALEVITIGLGGNQTDQTFAYNTISVRAEIREALTVTLPEAICVVTFAGGS